MDSLASVEIAVDWQLRMASLSLAEIQNDSELSQLAGWGVSDQRFTAK